ncbi:unnamed protein product, partial [Discosporangium mesarthrocarpum]
MSLSLPQEEMQRASKRWSDLGIGLIFFDALGGVVFLPVLPALASSLGTGGYSRAVIWVGVLGLAYYGGRSGLLLTARLACPTPPLPSPCRLSFLLCLSALVYAATGAGVTTVNGPSALQGLLVSRLFLGVLAAAQHSMGIGCFDLAASLTGTSPAAAVDPISRDAPASLAGLTVGVAAGGLLFGSEARRPVLAICLLIACMHIFEVIFVLLLWRGKLPTGESSTEYESVGGHPEGEGKQASYIHADGDVELATWVTHGDEGRPESVEPALLVNPSAPGPGTGDGEAEVPARYLRGCGGDEVEAERRWRATLEWRAQERVDEVLMEPQTHFDLIKQHYPHYFHRRARNGCPVYYERLGKINLEALKRQGVSGQALQRHYIFVTEYLWRVLEPDFEHGQTVTVFDVEGLGMRDLAGDTLAFAKKAMYVIQEHYVERSHKMFIINAPSFFGVIWRVLRPLVNERTQAKVNILSANRERLTAALLEVIAPEDLPREYGGSCPLGLGESEEEDALRAFVACIPSGPQSSGLASGGLATGRGAPHNSGGSWGSQGTPAASATTASRVKVEGQGDSDSDGDEVVEVDLYTSAVGHKSESVLGGRRGGGGCHCGQGRNTEAGHGGRGRRVLGRIGGALGWAGGALRAIRGHTAPVAYLGEENGFEYDLQQQRWVLRSAVDGARHLSAEEKGNVEGKGSGEAGGGLRSQEEHGQDSVNSEDLMVLAIQVGERGGLRFAFHADTPANVTNTLALSHLGDDKYILPCPSCGGGAGMRVGQGSRLGQGSGLGLGPGVGQRRGPALASVWYGLLASARESLPIWALARASEGGLGATPRAMGLAMALGVLLAA